MDYQSAGVNIDNGNKAVELIKDSVQSTHTPLVLSKLGGFAAGVELPLDRYKKPVLVSATDGVGTKLKIAIDYDKLEGIGIDCVAMSVNDLICMGAEPLFFLDYIACHHIDPDKMKRIVDSVVVGCKQSSCALVGGEMAEMNDMYQGEDFDIAGFCVGIVEKDEVISGQSIQEGDFIYALPASGVHSNGFSLVRKIMKETPVLESMSIDALLEPTKIYVDDLNAIKKEAKINGIANITGGGIKENLVRIVPNEINAVIYKNAIKVLPVFNILQEYGNVTEEEMYRVFNMGVGMVVVSSEDIEGVRGAYKIGVMEKGNQQVLLK